MWSEKEESILFKGIKLFGKDFEALADHIKTKSKEQVV